MSERGKRRHFATVEQNGGTAQNTYGEIADSWTTYAQAWCSLKEMSGRELEHAQQKIPNSTHKVRLDWIEGLTTDMRLYINDRAQTLHIENVENIDHNDVEMILLCKEAA